MAKHECSLSIANLARLKLRSDLGKIVSEGEYPLSPGERTSFKADASIKFSPNWLVFLEIEEHQSHPDTNVSKYWTFLDSAAKGLDITLIQVFGSEFAETENNYKSRKDLCSVIAGKIRKEHKTFDYVPLDLKGRFSSVDYTNHPEKIADYVADFVKKHLNKHTAL